VHTLFIFDMGGVVAGNTAAAPGIAAALGISLADFYRGAGSDPDAKTSPYHLGDVGAFMRGELSTEQFWRNFTRRTGIPVTGDPWHDYFHPELQPETLEIITDLKNAGFRVVCGTNTLDAHYRKHSQRGDYDCFDRVYASHLMGIIKPHPDFWRHILAAEETAPEEAFFIDDYEENVAAAAKLGLGTHLFTTPQGLKQALRAESFTAPRYSPAYWAPQSP
jgi:putative hydrolase of the HAD superfamily